VPSGSERFARSRQLPHFSVYPSSSSSWVSSSPFSLYSRQSLQHPRLICSARFCLRDVDSEAGFLPPPRVSHIVVRIHPADKVRMHQEWLLDGLRKSVELSAPGHRRLMQERSTGCLRPLMTRKLKTFPHAYPDCSSLRLSRIGGQKYFSSWILPDPPHMTSKTQTSYIVGSFKVGVSRRFRTPFRWSFYFFLVYAFCESIQSRFVG
jgi:hypothetical protein